MTGMGNQTRALHLAFIELVFQVSKKHIHLSNEFCRGWEPFFTLEMACFSVSKKFFKYKILVLVQIRKTIP